MNTTECRAALLSLVQAHPGITTPEIVRRMGWTRAQILSDLRTIGPDVRMKWDPEAPTARRAGAARWYPTTPTTPEVPCPTT